MPKSDSDLSDKTREELYAELVQLVTSMLVEVKDLRIEKLKSRELLEMAYQTLVGTQVSDTWPDVIDQLEAYLRPKEWHARNKPGPEGCKHTDSDGVSTIYLQERILFDPAGNHSVVVRCSLCGKTGNISLNGEPLVWDKGDTNEN